ncbi:hypothetical protein ACMHYB_33410 [Sorangium sp. So ce1128]
MGRVATQDLRERFEVWFLTGSHDLCGEETLKQVAAHAREIAGYLDASGKLPVNVVWKPTLKSPEAILAVCREASATPRCAGVITWMHTLSPAKMWTAGLLRLEKPMVHLHTQYNRKLPWESIDMSFMNLNQSANADREFGYIGARLRIDRKVVVGHWKDDDVLAKLDVWARAACAISDARRLKIARFGGTNMRDVAVTGGDRVHHCAHSRAIAMEHVEDFAAIAGVELIRIGYGTEIHALKNELRWNDLAYRLSQ